MPMTPEELNELTAKQKNRELDLREREVAAKEKEGNKSAWTNPLVIGLFAAAIGLIGNIFVARVNNQNTQAIERVHAQSALILESVKTDKKTACDNLTFFVNLGFIDDAANTIRRGCPGTENQNPIPSLPTASIQGLGSLEPFVVRVVDKNSKSIVHATVLFETDLASGACSTSEDGECRFEVASTIPQAKIRVVIAGFRVTGALIKSREISTVVMQDLKKPGPNSSE